jgi:hypothetical protein
MIVIEGQLALVSDMMGKKIISYNYQQLNSSKNSLPQQVSGDFQFEPTKRALCSVSKCA